MVGEVAFWANMDPAFRCSDGMSEMAGSIQEEASKSTAESTPVSAEAATVHIVYVDRPEGEEPEAFHIRTLSSVFGSEDAAREALIYHYKHSASGFSAKLTPRQVTELSQKPGVLQVVPSRTFQLHSGNVAAVHRLN
ncbi:hypothetical protein HPP92_002745 [Vanilla planifolia]|uniref:Inhibitor I9 domain-containing protein n=1 Tax=Vanilla planifolia TaxID=51239 RepID=A0A835VMS6_VANPL|nr:hypothetical protein HPP92_002745 [Vanilla planifolia]